jgi:hypothetical protein
MTALLVPIALIAFSQSPALGKVRYAVTATPLDVGLSAQKLCIAVNADDSHGIWWWEPGWNGCASRSTGPGVFNADGATVSRKGDVIDASFRLGLHVHDHLDVRIVIERGRIRSQSGGDVAADVRADLDVPGYQ